MPISLATGLLIGGGLSAIGGIGSALLGRSAQRRSDRFNRWAAEQNFAQQEEERRLQREMADRLYRTMTAPVVDARGDRTEYTEDLGWVTIPSEMSRRLISAADSEQLRRLTQDAHRTRRGEQENERRRIQESGVADAFLARMLEPDRYTSSDIADLLFRRALSGTGDAFDTARQNVSRTAVRSGIDPSRQLAELTRQQALQNQQAGMDAEIQALGLADNLNNQRGSQNASLYNIFAARAAGVPQAQFIPTNINEQLAAQLANTRNASSNAGLATVSAAGRPGGRYEQRSPDLSNALAFGSIFDSLGGMANQFAMGQYLDRRLANQGVL